jgi:hypothetical protein
MMHDNGYKPYGYKLDDSLPLDKRIIADYELKIPGDLAQRATIARQLNPTFTLSDEYIMNSEFPDIKNPIEEFAKISADKARKSPEAIAVAEISAYRAEAVTLRKARDFDGAQLYEKLATRKEQLLLDTLQPEQPQSVQPNVRVRPEVVPNRQSTQVEGGTQ